MNRNDENIIHNYNTAKLASHAGGALHTEVDLRDKNIINIDNCNNENTKGALLYNRTINGWSFIL